MVEETVLLEDEDEDDVATRVIMVVGVILGVTGGEGDDTGGSTTGVTDGEGDDTGGSTIGVMDVWAVGLGTGVVDVEEGVGVGDGVLEELDDELCPPTGDAPPGDPLPGDEEPPEQRPEDDGFGKTKECEELASWQELPSHKAPELTGSVEGGLWMMVWPGTEPKVSSHRT